MNLPEAPHLRDQHLPEQSPHSRAWLVMNSMRFTLLVSGLFVAFYNTRFSSS
jgi:hypothetical protein